MTDIKTPSTHELLRDIDAIVFSSVKEKKNDVFLSYTKKNVEVFFQLSNLYRLLMADSYQSFSNDKKDFDTLPQKEKEKYKNSTTYKLIEEKNDKEVQELKYKVTSNIGKTTGEIITILNGLMSNNKFNFTMSDSSQTKDNNTESDLKKLQ